MNKYESELNDLLTLVGLKKSDIKAKDVESWVAQLYKKAYIDGHIEGYRIAEIEVKGY